MTLKNSNILVNKTIANLTTIINDPKIAQKIIVV